MQNWTIFFWFPWKIIRKCRGRSKLMCRESYDVIVSMHDLVTAQIFTVT